jgi:integrase
MSKDTPQRDPGQIKRGRARKPLGTARAREPIKDRASGIWRARYVDFDGTVRQCGRFATKGAAREHTTAFVAALNLRGRAPGISPTFNAFLEEWPRRFPRHPWTERTNVERINRYIVPLLPGRGDVPLDEIRRADLRTVQGALLERRLSKSTIDGAFSALSSLFRDAKDLEFIDTNPAAEMRVKRNDPRLAPVVGEAKRRALSLDEVHAFIERVPERWQAACWMPALSGCRPGELFAANRADIDRDRQLIYLHQTVDRYGRLMDGLKSTHHIREKDERGRWTLFPAPLNEMFGRAPVSLNGTLVPSPRGKYWCIRNWYRNVWDPAMKRAGVDPFTLYDLRHSFSSWLQSAGIPAIEVSAWMGHSLRVGGVDVMTTTTRIYSHATGQWREAALQELAAIIRGDRRERVLGARQGRS